MRHADRLAMGIVVVTLIQLTLGTVLVVVLHGQSQDTINATIAQRTATLDSRVSAIESLMISPRLAVLERAADDMREVRQMTYGVIVTLFGSLFAQLVQIRDARKRRRSE